MNRMITISILLCIWFTPANAQVPAPSQGDELEILARNFIRQLEKEDFSSAAAAFDVAMAKALPPEALQKNWEVLIRQAGPYKRQGACRRQSFERYDILFVTCEFERAMIDVKIALNPQKKISGLFFLPSQTAETNTSEDNGRSDACIEKEVCFETQSIVLPGTLSLPKNEGKFPVVVLIHGSGPQDRDETIGPNKPFRDLAWGLAAKGIAVLRYEKGTRHDPARFAKMKARITVEEETVADALAAVDLLRQRPEIDKQRIFVLGHSLGGMLIPRIGLRDEQTAGFIIMAGTARPLEDVIYEQFVYLSNIDDRLTDAETAQLKQLTEQVQLVKSPELDPNTPSSRLPLAIPASYWLDLRNEEPAKKAARLTRPILILQGERDYQVTMDDFRTWQDALASHQNVRFRSFPRLNHLFMEGSGKSTPAEYEKPGHVDQSVIDALGDFVHKRGFGN
jgi:dienelactone hydrolase